MFYKNTQQLAEHKLLLLYILDRFEIPLTNTQLTQFVMERDYMNYFLLQQFLGELVSSNMLEYSESEGNFFYLITEKGKNTLQFFRDRLSEELTDALNHAIEMKKQILLKEMQILANYTKKKENEYVVDLKVIENDIVLIDLKLNVVSNKYAKEICDKWKQDAPKLYGEIIHLLIQ